MNPSFRRQYKSISDLSPSSSYRIGTKVTRSKFLITPLENELLLVKRKPNPQLGTLSPISSYQPYFSLCLKLSLNETSTYHELLPDFVSFCPLQQLEMLLLNRVNDQVVLGHKGLHRVLFKWLSGRWYYTITLPMKANETTQKVVHQSCNIDNPPNIYSILRFGHQFGGDRLWTSVI